MGSGVDINGVWCSSVGCSVAKRSVAQLGWVRRSSVGCGVAQWGAA